MPIFDYDGTASLAIGKLYDHDGATAHQIAKVYDNDGSVDSLIYKAEQYLYNAGDLYTEVGGSWTSSGYSYTTSFGFVYSLTEATYQATDIYLYKPAGLYMDIAGKSDAISLTDWGTLTAEIRVMNSDLESDHIADGRWGGLYVATSKSDVSAVRANYFNGAISKTLTAKTLTIDVSALTGDFYIFAAGGNGTTLYIDSILLT